MDAKFKWLVLTAFLIAFTQCAAPPKKADPAATPDVVGEDVHLRFVNPKAQDTFIQRYLRDFAEELKKRSHGRVKVSFIYDNEKQSGRSASKVSAGEFDLGFGYAHHLADFSTDMLIFDLPFLFRDYDHVERVVGGPIGEELGREDLAANNLVRLAYTYSGGLETLVNLRSRRPATHPKDFEGMKLGSYQSAVKEIWLKKLGATYVRTNCCGRSFLSSFKGGKLDGLFLTYSKVANFLELTGRARRVPAMMSVTDVNASLSMGMIVANKRSLDALSPAVRELILATGREFSVQERKDDLKRFAEIRAELAKQVKVYQVSESERRALERALAPTYSEMASRIDQKLVERIQAEAR